jgi:hypothetical protein
VFLRTRYIGSPLSFPTPRNPVSTVIRIKSDRIQIRRLLTGRRHVRSRLLTSYFDSGAFRAKRGVRTRCSVGCIRRRSAWLAAISMLLTAGLGLAGATIATPADARVGGYTTHVGGYATHGHGGCGACHGEHERSSAVRRPSLGSTTAPVPHHTASVAPRSAKAPSKMFASDEPPLRPDEWLAH